MRAALVEGNPPSRYPIRGIFVGCCAQTGRQSAKSMAQSVRTVIFLVMFFSALSIRKSTLDAHSLSFDHPVRPRQHVRRNCEADLLRSFQIDYKLKLRRLLHWQISWLRAFEDSIDVIDY